MPQKFALIIGNSDYQDSALARLAMPEADVKGLAEVLQDPAIGGFEQVTPLVNHSAADVRLEIESFFADKKPDDLLLLYFTGHGVRDDQGQLYLAVNDTKHNRLRATAVPASFVTGEMDSSRSRRQILILDCCHSGSFAQGSKAMTGESVGTKSAFEGIGYGRVVLTATDSTQYAWEGDQIIGDAQNSLFTYYLLQGLCTGEADTDGDGNITLEELYDYVYGEVVKRTPKQTPGKWSYKQQGEIVIARNPKPAPKPSALPAELQETIADSRSWVREGAVRELDRLLHGKHAGLARAAQDALQRMTDDDSRHVAELAKQLLAAYAAQQEQERRAQAQAEAEQQARLKAEQERIAQAQAEVKQQARLQVEQEQQARAKAEAEQRERERIEQERRAAEEREQQRQAALYAEAERQKRERAEQERLAKERAEADRLAREKAEAERLAKEKAEQEQLAHEQAEAEQRKQQVATLYALGRKHYDGGRWRDALDYFRQVKESGGDYEDLNALITAAQREVAKEQSPIIPAAPPLQPRTEIQPVPASRNSKPLWVGGGIIGMVVLMICGIGLASAINSGFFGLLPVPNSTPFIAIADTATPKATANLSGSAPTTTPTLLPVSPVPILAPTAAATATPTNAERATALIQKIDEPWGKGDWLQVIDLLTQARALDASNQVAADKLYVAYYNYGQVLLGQGKKDEAAQQFQNALQVKPAGDEAKQALLSLSPTPTLRPTVTPIPRTPGLVLDFEDELSWRRGDQPYGTFTRSPEQVKAGTYANKLSYDFPAVLDNYVVFHPRLPIALPGKPTGLSAWVYGDSSGHFLNVWIQDAAGEVRQYTFGQIKHRGWQQMFAPFDEGRGWPNVHISGPDNSALDYPVSLYVWLLDGVPDGQASRGAIYLDEVYIATQPIVVATATPPPSTDKYDLALNVKNYEQWGRPSPDSCSDFNNRSPVRKLNVDVTLTNLSPQTIVNWSLEFYNNVGARARVCYFGYENSVSYPTVPPNQSRTLTAAVFTELSQSVAELRATVEGQVLRRCFDGTDGHEISCQ